MATIKLTNGVQLAAKSSEVPCPDFSNVIATFSTLYYEWTATQDCFVRNRSTDYDVGIMLKQNGERYNVTYLNLQSSTVKLVSAYVRKGQTVRLENGAMTVYGLL